MEAKILKKNIPNELLVDIPNSSLEKFLKYYLNAEFKEDGDNYVLIEIPKEDLIEEKYKDKIWYRSKSRRFGLFYDAESKFIKTDKIGWRVLFQK